jgi:SH3-like domain-containing protein
MGPSVEPWCANLLYLPQRLAVQRACVCPSGWMFVILVSLLIAALPWQVAAETTSAPASNVSEPTVGAIRRGIVTLMSNLRASPSIQSEIVAIAKEGTHVDILVETERWFRVRNDDGVEAWIYKPLVVIERELLTHPSATPPPLVPSDSKGVRAEAAVKSEVFAESRADNAPEQLSSVAPPATPFQERHISSETPGTAWFIDTIRLHVQGLGTYIIVALGAVLVLSIAFQLRAARQLRRAMLEMGQILDIVEEIYTGGGLAPKSDRSAPMILMPAEAQGYQPPTPVIEFSPIEHAVLEALSDQHPVQEGVLGKILDEKGFAGLLIKAVIGDIVRKTEATGVPWVEVRYAQGRYSYQLRPEAVSGLCEQASDGLEGREG